MAFLEKSVSLRNFGTYVRYAKSKHVLAVFDSCFAGTIFSVARSRTPPAITRVTTEPVRQFLTSGDAGQEVSDDGRFARIFIEALEGRRRADANGDGYLTGTEIGEHLTYEIANLSHNAQTPKYGKLLSDRYNKGDFVFVLPGTTTNQHGSFTNPTNPDHTAWQAIQNSTNPVDFQTFLSAFSNSSLVPFAKARLQALQKNTEVSSAHPTSLDVSGLTPVEKLDMSGLNLIDQKEISSPADIHEVQRLLLELGYSPGPSDGVLGPKTREAVMRFQRQEGLPVNGRLSNVVLKQLRKGYAQKAAIRAFPGPDPGIQTTPAVGVYFRPGQTFRDCDICPEMVVIPPGSFKMGSEDGNPSEKPAHRVNIGYSFAVGKYEVTQIEWRTVMGYNPSQFQGDRYPIEKVSWVDAKDFISKLSEMTGQTYRLLSEAEWEYVARAGTRTQFSCGDAENCLLSTAVYKANSQRRTEEVGSKSANAFGLYDLYGNVWEWTEDCWNGSYLNAPTDGGANYTGHCPYRVDRGGAWSSRSEDLRSAARIGRGTGDLGSHLGFRVARTLQPTEVKIPPNPQGTIKLGANPTQQAVDKNQAVEWDQQTNKGRSARIVIRAKSDSWVQVRDDADRRLLVTRLLRAGDTYIVPDRKGLSLLTGNARALEILVDGQVVGPIGEEGAVRLNFTLDAEKLVSGTAVID